MFALVQYFKTNFLLYIFFTNLKIKKKIYNQACHLQEIKISDLLSICKAK